MFGDGRRTPFTLLGGYLGAGKTTIVNHVVGAAGGRRIVVLVNDVGAVDVDAALIAEHDGRTLSLTNGCVCCAIADDFAQTLDQVRGFPEPPDHVLMELSGVAEPARVAPWADTPGFSLDGIVVAVDADQIVEQVDHPYVGDTVRTQLAAADLLVVTKTDLVGDAGEAAERVLRRYSRAPVVRSDRGAVAVDVLLGIRRTDVGAAGPVPVAPTGPRTAHRTEVVRVGHPPLAELSRWVESLPDDVMRVKGLVRCADTSGLVEVQVVGRRRSVSRRPDLADERATDGVVVISARSSVAGG